METRRLGRTEHLSSVAILGGAAFWDSDETTTSSLVADAMAAGVNHIDVAPQYGRAEVLLGPAIEANRTALFVAGKTLRHHADGVRAQLDETLAKLRVDQLDLYQLHAVTDLEELDRRRDAVEVLLEARDQGLCRFIGITGHNVTTPRAQLEALRRYDLDTVMVPIYPTLLADLEYRHDLEALLEAAAERDVGVMAIKAGARRPWGDTARTASTWYEPHHERTDLAQGIRFALSTPGVTGFCTPGDVAIARVAIEIAAGDVAMDEAQRAALVAASAREPVIFPIPS